MGGVVDDVASCRPQLRQERVGVGAGCVAGEVEAIGVAAEFTDLPCLVDDFLPGRGALLRIEPGLRVQVLVPEQRRSVHIERHAVDLSVIAGRYGDVAWAQVGLVGVRVDLVGDGLEQTLVDEVGHEDQVHVEQVGQVTRARRSRHTRDIVGGWDDGQLDLVGVRGVELRDEFGASVHELTHQSDGCDGASLKYVCMAVVSVMARRSSRSR